jgi:hypothetical protein
VEAATENFVTAGKSRLAGAVSGVITPNTGMRIIFLNHPTLFGALLWGVTSTRGTSIFGVAPMRMLS